MRRSERKVLGLKSGMFAVDKFSLAFKYDGQTDREANNRKLLVSNFSWLENIAGLFL